MIYRSHPLFLFTEHGQLSPSNWMESSLSHPSLATSGSTKKYPHLLLFVARDIPLSRVRWSVNRIIPYIPREGQGTDGYMVVPYPRFLGSLCLTFVASRRTLGLHITTRMDPMLWNRSIQLQSHRWLWIAVVVIWSLFTVLPHTSPSIVLNFAAVVLWLI